MAEKIHDALIARLNQRDQGDQHPEVFREDVSEEQWAATMDIVAERAKQELALEEDQEESSYMRRPAFAFAGTIAGTVVAILMIAVNVDLGWLAVPVVLSGACVVAGLTPALGRQARAGHNLSLRR